MPFPIGIAQKAPENPKKDDNAPSEDPYACMQCDRHLTPDEIGLYKKMVNRGAKRFLCIDCLAAYYGTTVAAMEERIAYFRASGCSLFH